MSCFTVVVPPEDLEALGALLQHPDSINALIDVLRFEVGVDLVPVRRHGRFPRRRDFLGCPRTRLRLALGALGIVTRPFLPLGLRGRAVPLHLPWDSLIWQPLRVVAEDTAGAIIEPDIPRRLVPRILLGLAPAREVVDTPVKPDWTARVEAVFGQFPPESGIRILHRVPPCSKRATLTRQPQPHPNPPQSTISATGGTGSRCPGRRRASTGVARLKRAAEIESVSRRRKAMTTRRAPGSGCC